MNTARIIEQLLDLHPEFSGEIRDEARQFLQTLADRTTGTLATILPIGVWLLHRGDEFTMLDVDSIVDYCRQREPAISLLNTLPSDDDYDPAAEFLVAIADGVLQKLKEQSISSV